MADSQLASGIYNYLPLGLRTLSKVIKIVDQEMESVGGQKLNMPKLLPKELWERTGRWNDMGNELIRLKDRKGEDFCLAPTHEEIVTSLAAAGVSSHKQLPLRLYQIGDKYRDEPRPRFGLLRAREFVMKDMYSFDVTQEDAVKTYEEVREAYIRVMTRLELPFAIAEADSGNIGGNMSHEFHALAEVGEDTLLCCESKNYYANVEKAKSSTVATIDTTKIPAPLNADAVNVADISTFKQLLDHLSLPLEKTTVRATVFTEPGKPGEVSIALTDVSYEANSYLVKGALGLGAEYTAVPLDSESKQAFLDAKTKRVIFDSSFSAVSGAGQLWISKMESILKSQGALIETAHVKVAKVGDACLCVQPDQVACNGGFNLSERKGIEVGHLFYLGTKYSAPLKAMVTTKNATQPIEMGCYGIGVSRLLAVAVETSHDAKGIVWPKAIAPFRVMVIPIKQTVELGKKVVASLEQLECLSGDVMLDDRYADSVGYRLKESEFIGIPYALVLGSKFEATGKAEVLQRSDGKTFQLSLDELPSFFNAQFPATL